MNEVINKLTRKVLHLTLLIEYLNMINQRKQFLSISQQLQLEEYLFPHLRVNVYLSW